jgi:hypothetical protein
LETLQAILPEGTPEGAKYKVTLSDNASKYFDATFKELVAQEPAP